MHVTQFHENSLRFKFNEFFFRASFVSDLKLSWWCYYGIFRIPTARNCKLTATTEHGTHIKTVLNLSE